MYQEDFIHDVDSLKTVLWNMELGDLEDETEASLKKLSDLFHRVQNHLDFHGVRVNEELEKRNED